MADYSSIQIIPGMLGIRNGWTYQVLSVVDNVVTGLCMDDATTAQMGVDDLKALCTSGDMRIEWPPNLRQENMPS